MSAGEESVKKEGRGGLNVIGSTVNVVGDFKAVPHIEADACDWSDLCEVTTDEPSSRVPPVRRYAEQWVYS